MVTFDEFFEAIWQQILDKDDRTSPEEYPEMVMLTHDELKDYMKRATTLSVDGA